MQLSHVTKPDHATATRVRSPTRSSRDDLRERLVAALPVTERQLSLNGIATAVLEGGEGSPVLLLHGPGGYAAQWVFTIPHLAKTHRAIAPDLPGHGASQAFNGTPDVERVLGWLDDLIDCTCASAPVLVGHTLGGAIAARYAAERGERVAALVLVDALGLTAFTPTPEFGAALNEFLSAPSPETHDRLWGQCALDLAALTRRLGPRWDAIKAYNLAGAQAANGIAALVALMGPFAMRAIHPETLARIGVPTALVWGRQDRATPLAVAEAASRRYGWPLHVIDDAADDPTLEQPEAFLAALDRVLAPR
jgi:pimeloyl-ACP methyl ester carboxylesterase